MAKSTVKGIAKQLFDAATARAAQHDVKLRPVARQQIEAMAKLAANTISKNAKNKPQVIQEAYKRGAVRLAVEGMNVIIDEMTIARIRLPNYLASHPDSVGEATLAEALKILCPLWPFC